MCIRDRANYATYRKYTSKEEYFDYMSDIDDALFALKEMCIRDSSKAGGAKIYKLKYGHHSHNQPVRMVGTERCFITSQNHGYAVDNNTLGCLLYTSRCV